MQVKESFFYIVKFCNGRKLVVEAKDYRETSNGGVKITTPYGADYYGANRVAMVQLVMYGKEHLLGYSNSEGKVDLDI